MSRIKGRDTKPELDLRRAVWALGLRYRKKGRLRGRPDMIFPGSKVAVFVDGCFWHQCPLHAVRPKGNRSFWDEKLRRNVERDREVDRDLAADGWTVIRVWEHEVEEDVQSVAHRIQKVLMAH